MPKISVIIPVYNGADTLRHAISSVRRQSFSDWQLVIVDDASTDNSRQIAVAAAERDNRITFAAHPSNEGLYMARMTGIGRAEGEWVTFLDADDWLSPRAIERLVSAANSDADIILMNFRYRLSALHLPYSPTPLRASGKESSEQLSCRLKQSILGSEASLPTGVWGKAFRASTLQSTVFPDYQAFWGEDRIFLLSLLQSHITLRAIDYMGYNYRWGGSSKRFSLDSINQYHKYIDTASQISGDNADLERLHLSLIEYFTREGLVAGVAPQTLAEALSPYCDNPEDVITRQSAEVRHRRFHYFLRRFA